MNKTHYEISQINFGLILSGKRTPHAYLEEEFSSPFDEMLRFIKSKEDWSKEDLYAAKFAPSELDGAIGAVNSLNSICQGI